VLEKIWVWDTKPFGSALGGGKAMWESQAVQSVIPVVSAVLPSEALWLNAYLNQRDKY